MSYEWIVGIGIGRVISNQAVCAAVYSVVEFE